MEKEMLAIVKGLAHFRCYVLGHLIIVKTDNKNLTMLGFINQRVEK